MSDGLAAMEPEVTTDSGFLIDQPEFKNHLAQLELAPDRAQTIAKARHRTLAEWAEQEGLTLSPPDQSEELERRPRRRRRSGHGLSAVGFIGLMGVGAGVAAVVFHDQVLRILATL